MMKKYAALALVLMILVNGLSLAEGLEGMLEDVCDEELAVELIDEEADEELEDEEALETEAIEEIVAEAMTEFETVEKIVVEVMPVIEAEIVEEPVIEEAAVIETETVEETVVEEAAVIETEIIEEPVIEEETVIETEIVEEPVVEEEPVIETEIVEEPVIEEESVIETEIAEEPVIEEESVIETEIAEESVVEEEPVIETEIVEEPVIETVKEIIVEQPVTGIDVREQADGMSPIMATVAEDAAMETIAREGDWVQVQVNGMTGWVYSPAAVEEILPTADMKVTIFSSRRSTMAMGETVTLSSTLQGFDGYEVMYQWRCDSGCGFADVAGANGATYQFSASPETLKYSWMLMVYFRPVQ